MSSKWTKVAEVAIEIAKQIIKSIMGREMGSYHFVDGGIFVSCMANGKILAARWHPTKRHRAVCLHGKKVVQRAESDAGYWAVAYANKAWWGNKNKYNDDSDDEDDPEGDYEDSD